MFPLLLSAALALAPLSGGDSCPAARITTDELIRIPAVRSVRDSGAWFPDPSAVVVRLSPGPIFRAVAALSWEGPRGGILVLLGCDKRVLAITELGAVDSLRAVNVSTPDAVELLAFYESGSGTGFQQRSATLFALDHDSLSVRWSGITFEGNYPWQMAGWSEERARIFLAPGRIMRVGRIQPLKEARDGQHVFARGAARRFQEVYLWDGARFVRVRGAKRAS